MPRSPHMPRDDESPPPLAPAHPLRVQDSCFTMPPCPAPPMPNSQARLGSIPAAARQHTTLSLTPHTVSSRFTRAHPFRFLRNPGECSPACSVTTNLACIRVMHRDSHNSTSTHLFRAQRQQRLGTSPERKPPQRSHHHILAVGPGHQRFKHLGHTRRQGASSMVCNTGTAMNLNQGTGTSAGRLQGGLMWVRPCVRAARHLAQQGIAGQRPAVQHARLEVGKSGLSCESGDALRVTLARWWAAGQGRGCC